MTEQQIAELRLKLGINTLETITKWHVIRTLNESQGNVQRTAQLLDVGRGTLYRWIKEWNITRTGEIK